MRKIKIVILVVGIVSYFSCFSETPLLEEEARYYRRLGLRAQENGDLETALRFYQKAIQIDPYFSEVYNDLGVVYEALGKDKGAEESYLKAIEINPKNLPAYSNLALFYEKKGKFDKAAKYWKLRFKLGRRGELWREKARQHLKILSSRFPQLKKDLLEDEMVDLSKKISYQKKKRAQEAKEFYEMGLSFFNQGKYSQAKKEFEKIIRMSPSKGMLMKAKRMYKKSVREEIKERFKSCVQQSLLYFEEDSYLLAGQELKKALGLISEILKEQE